MNEQIQNLKDKIWTEEYWTNPNTDKLLPAQLNRFAELIVRECILTIQMGITRDGHNTEKYLRSIKHIKQIKEHFGVEE